MEDEKIIALYLQRSEEAIYRTEEQYGRLCRNISKNILRDLRDIDECINDTWIALWNSIPPKEPNPLKAYICRVVKNLALKKHSFLGARKRSTAYDLSLEELSECCGGAAASAEEALLLQELTDSINHFLTELPAEKRILFMRRYWFFQPVKEIARAYGITEKSASMKLSRLRKQLREYLSERGFDL